LVSGNDEDFPELWEEDDCATGFAAFAILLLSDSIGVLDTAVGVEA
jgi:hypothetical protein